MNEMKPLNDEQLEKVSGGDDTRTQMRCVHCQYDPIWVGDFYGKVFVCSNCGWNGLRGVDVWGNNSPSVNPEKKK